MPFGKPHKPWKGSRLICVRDVVYLEKPRRSSLASGKTSTVRTGMGSLDCQCGHRTWLPSKEELEMPYLCCPRCGHIIGLRPREVLREGYFCPQCDKRELNTPMRLIKRKTPSDSPPFLPSKSFRRTCVKCISLSSSERSEQYGSRQGSVANATEQPNAHP